MAREKIKKELIPIQSLDEVDGILLEIAKKQIELDRINANAEEKILQIREQAKMESESILESINQMAESIFAYIELNKTKIFVGDKKTIELQYGLCGYRKSTKISVSKSTLELLKAMGYNEAIRIKEEVNKEVMKDWDDAKLAAVKAKKVVEDSFWYETRKEKVIELEKKKSLANL
ncbi:MAG: hypothetical protein HPY78_03485 [Brevinematales bacterium]|nr:hypothetical protein [Brevinematales bacterium]